MKKISLFLFFTLAFFLLFTIACAKEVTYTVSFTTGTEETIASQTIKEGEKVTEPSDPTKEGHDFAGWYCNEIEYDFESPVKSDLTLTAKWNAYYIVSFATGTDAKIDDQKLYANDKVVKPNDPTKEGSVFEGWLLNGEAFDFNSDVTSNITLTAKWSNVYTVVFKANGTIIETVTVKHGDTAEAPNYIPSEDKILVGWDKSLENVTGNLEVNAVLEDVTFEVIYVVDGNIYHSIPDVKYGGNATAPNNPEKLGYTFAGWDNDGTNVTSALTITASFDVIEYDIKYYDGTNELTTNNPTKYTVEDEIALAPYVPTSTGEKLYFVGWYANNKFTGEGANSIVKGTTGDLAFYALNVKADSNGGADCWETTPYETNNEAGSGIDAISSLPEMFERDFFNYLSTNNLLESDKLDPTMVASTWEAFSGLNPNHNGDPRRIWNDTSSNGAGAANGYVALFLYEELAFNDDGSLKDIKGGFLGSEPYKSKYFGLMDLLIVLHSYKVTNNNYDPLSNNTAKSRAFLAFVIDGYFYGTQGVATDYFTVARNLIPGTTYGYKLNGNEVVKVEYNFATLPNYVKVGYDFAGWYLDPECTKELGSIEITSTPTLYAKWVEIA